MNLDGMLAASTRTVVLVEGDSDRAAIDALAARRALPLPDLGVQIIAMGGITNIGHYLAALAEVADPEVAAPEITDPHSSTRLRAPGTDLAEGHRSPGEGPPAGERLPAVEHTTPPPTGPARTVRLCGLYDAAEERFVVNGLDRAGLRPSASAAPLASAGFFRCERDLEDELLRAVGTERFLALIGSEGELGSFERLRRQPAQQGWSTTRVLHRFLGSRSGRKERYARRLVEVLPLDRVPEPLDAVLRRAVGDGVAQGLQGRRGSSTTIPARGAESMAGTSSAASAMPTTRPSRSCGRSAPDDTRPSISG